MSLRYSELAQVVAELEEAFSGATVQKAWAPLPGLAYLEVRHHAPAQGWRSSVLCLSAETDLSRLSVTRERFPSPPEPPPFQRWLRQSLVEAKVQRLALAGDDRIVRLELGGHVLVAELIPGRGALVLLAVPEDRILAVSSPGEPRPELKAGARWTAPAASLPADARALPSRLVGPPFAEAAEALFADRQRQKRAEAIRRRLEQPLRARRDRLRRTIEKVRAEAARRPEAERLRRLGELLSHNLHAARRGQREVRLTEYTEEGAQEVTVPLDPRRTPKEEVEHLFHQYRRLLRGSEAAAARLVQLERELSEAEAQVTALAATSPEALLERPEVLATPARTGPQAARPFREYTGSGGGKIWVGKTGEGNDALTFKTARPGDLWLHARGVPGAHVVIPLERGAELPQELLLDAAHLAMHHSQLKSEPRGEVSYTQAKFVRRVKDAAPGQVTYTREKTFAVRVEPDRLERLLRSAAD